MSDAPAPVRRHWPLIALAAIAVVVCAAGVAVAVADDSGSSGATDQGSCVVTRVAQDALPSVVTILVHGEAASGSGSGEVIRNTGEILTNDHVIAAAATRGTIEVLFNDGVTAVATLVGRDPRTDLAVIKTDAARSYPVIPFGSAADLQVGEPVVALGAPVGLTSTVTSGIVSALDRTVQVPSSAGRPAVLVSAVQTDAAINPGNSGGALTDCAGDLVGVPTAGASVPNAQGQSSAGNIGLGFAIPSDLAKSVSDELIAQGSVQHSFFGIQLQTLPRAPGAEPNGLFVVAVTPGGPAERAGLRAGDVITTLDGNAAVDATQVDAITLTKKPGDEVAVGYERDGHHSTVTVVLGTAP